MKIALISPNVLFLDDYRMSEDLRLNKFVKANVKETKAFTPNYSLLQIAAFTPEEHELIYMDDQFDTVDMSADVDLAAITVLTSNADRAYEIADGFRRRSIPVVLGGIHVSLAQEDASGHADSIVIGDAQVVWKKLLYDAALKKLEPVYDGRGCDIITLPPPKLDLLTRDHFMRKVFNSENYILNCSFGCVRKCKFCSNWMFPGREKFQRKTLQQIEAELADITTFSDKLLLLLSDDNVFLDADYAISVLSIIKAYGLRWFGVADTSIASKPKLLKMIRESGCVFLMFGLESLNERNLKWMAPWKAKEAGRYRESVGIIRDQGINAAGSFIIGFEYDTKDTIREYYDFFIDAKLSMASVGILTPYPGTLLREKLIEEGRLDLNAKWGDYSCYNFLFRHDTLTKETVYDEMMWFLEKSSSPEAIEHIKSVTMR